MHSRSNPVVFATIFKAGFLLYSVKGGTFGRRELKIKLLVCSTKEKKINYLIYTRYILGN